MRGLARTRVPAAAAALSLLAAAGCAGTGEAGSRTLTVFAAASLTETFTAFGAAFEGTHPGVRVEFNFGGSSTLARQISQGAPADVFAAASPATMEPVAGAVSGPPRVFARNRLVIAVPKGGGARVRGLADLSGAGVKVVLCAVQVPCGDAARKALSAGGVTVRPVSLERDVKAVLTKVRLGEADAGLVYRSDARAAARDVEGVEFPESARAVNDYPIAALAEAPQPRLAGEFVRHVLSQGAALERAGFEPP